MPWREVLRDPRFWFGVAWELLLVGGGAYGLGYLLGKACGR